MEPVGERRPEGFRPLSGNKGNQLPVSAVLSAVNERKVSVPSRGIRVINMSTLYVTALASLSFRPLSGNKGNQQNCSRGLSRDAMFPSPLGE